MAVSLQAISAAVMRLKSEELSQKQRQGVLGALVLNVRRLINPEDQLNAAELQGRLAALTLVESVQDQFKPEVLEQMSAFKQMAEARIAQEVPLEAKKRGKPINPNSGRQQILAVLREAQTPMTPKEIDDALKARDREIKYISSHLNYFKDRGQVLHKEGKYSLV